MARQAGESTQKDIPDKRENPTKKYIPDKRENPTEKHTLVNQNQKERRIEQQRSWNIPPVKTKKNNKTS